MNSPRIPTRTCFLCGKGPTAETQSVFGIGHTSCYHEARLPPKAISNKPWPMEQFYHSHPMSGVKGLRSITQIVNGNAVSMVWLPDQVV